MKELIESTFVCLFHISCRCLPMFENSKDANIWKFCFEKNMIMKKSAKVVLILQSFSAWPLFFSADFSFVVLLFLKIQFLNLFISLFILTSFHFLTCVRFSHLFFFAQSLRVSPWSPRLPGLVANRFFVIKLWKRLWETFFIIK